MILNPREAYCNPLSPYYDAETCDTFANDLGGFTGDDGGTEYGLSRD